MWKSVERVVPDLDDLRTLGVHSRLCRGGVERSGVVQAGCHRTPWLACRFLSDDDKTVDHLADVGSVRERPGDLLEIHSVTLHPG